MKNLLIGLTVLVSMSLYASDSIEIEVREKNYLEMMTLKVLGTLGSEVDVNSPELFIVNTDDIHIEKIVFNTTIKGFYTSKTGPKNIRHRGKGSLIAIIQTSDGYLCKSKVTVSNWRYLNTSKKNNFNQYVPFIDRFDIVCTFEDGNNILTVFDELIDISGDVNANY